MRNQNMGQAEEAQADEAQPEEVQADEAQPEEVQADEAQPEADDGYPGGPVDRYVLKTYGDHVATRLWDGVDRGELRVFSNGKKLKEAVIENQEVEELVKSSGLYTLLKCSYEMIDKGLISAFVERWHRDTNSFHLPIGEMTITLDDVSSLLHIPIIGALFSVNIFNKDDAAELLGELLGVSLAAAYAEFNLTRTTTVRYSWLLDVYHQRCADQHWQMAARAFLLFLVGCTLFSDKSAFAVSVAYLECFRDLNSYGGYAWGIVVLAYLYDNLREASMHQTRTVSGYLTLLQALVLSQIYDKDYLRGVIWKPKRDKGLVILFRKALDEIDVDGICWTPYREHRLKRPFEVVSLFRGWIRRGPKMYAHLPDRVLRQYGHVQTIPGSPLEIVDQTTTPEEMDIMFTQYAVHVVDAGAVVHKPADCAIEYMEWFRRISLTKIYREKNIKFILFI
uniref:Protein MAIN-LIKE 1-like n=1 Tax=Cicer arietinum TaxID=3827 RepID=A0A1S3EF64_CICAR|nr:protein MAIN-LIKE 1-like [Cicer arietinum]